MSDYDLRAQQTAHRSLKPKSQGGKGQEVTLKSGTPGAYIPATGTSAPSTPAIQRGCGIELAYKASEINGTQILRGDKKFMLSALGVDGLPITMPKVGSHLVYATGARFRVEGVDPDSPAGTPVYAYVQLRDA